MSAKRGASGLSGILLVDKPSGLTSHDVVNRVRRATGEKRVGHAGTLDPMATGLLVVLVGPATRLAPYLTAAEKTYEAAIAFGTETDTDDAEGEVVREADVPAQLHDAARAREVLDGFLGRSLQVPPAYSAIKRDGVVAHRAARAGTGIELEARPIDVRAARLLAVDIAGCSWAVEFTVSKGTYVRGLARDIGRAVGSAAHLAALRRVRAGALAVADAVALDVIATAAGPAEIASLFADPVAALALPTIRVEEEGAIRVSAGQILDPHLHCIGECPFDGPVAIARDGVLLAVYARAGGVLRPQVVIPGGVLPGAAAVRTADEPSSTGPAREES